MPEFKIVADDGTCCCGYGKSAFKTYFTGWSWQFCRKRRHFQVIGHPAAFGWKHIPYVLSRIVENSSILLPFLADCRHQNLSKHCFASVCHFLFATYIACMFVSIVCISMFAEIWMCMLVLDDVYPAMLTSYCKQATDGRTAVAVADLVQLCLLGSNCVLTWRETEYYSHAGKQIIVTSLAGRWLYLSHVQMEFEENQLAGDAEWVGMRLCVRVHLTVCRFCPSLYLFVSSTAACLFPHISTCLLLYRGRCLNAAGHNIKKERKPGLEHQYTHLAHRLPFDAKHCPAGT